MRRLRRSLGKSLGLLAIVGTALIAYNEFFIYHVVTSRCAWPKFLNDEEAALVAERSQPNYKDNTPVHAMFLADTHLLGHFRGHWFDKLRREWQMYRSFQTALWWHQPDVVFILGDLLDEGQYAHQDELFNEYTQTFRQIFNTTGRRRKSFWIFGQQQYAESANSSNSIPLFTVVGNHDIGFHYRIYDAARHRFEKTFRAPGVKLLRFRQLLFVLMNSMAMEEDGCSMCREAETKLKQISERLQCSIVHEIGYDISTAKNGSGASSYCPKPISPMSNVILLQHFPLYRPSEAAVCDMNEADAAPASLRHVPYAERKDCLSQSATQKVLQWLKPRAVFGAHSHHGCYRIHEDGTKEWSVASFSWRNRINPNFLMASITRTRLAVNKCYVPYESTVIAIYILGIIFWLFCSWRVFTGRQLGLRPNLWTRHGIVSGGCMFLKHKSGLIFDIIRGRRRPSTRKLHANE